MERNLDSQIGLVKEKLFEMAGLVEKAIEHATNALIQRDLARLKEVYRLEDQINQAHLDVDDACVTLLATLHPFAADLRTIIAIIKINTDLERMGDQAVNIAHNSERYLANPPVKELVDFPVISSEVRWMVREALDSFVKNNQTMAHEVLERDDRVDHLKNKIFTEVVSLIKKNPNLIDPGLSLILIARNLERIGDHATNIAEDLIYALSGQDIRHSSRKPAAQGPSG